MAEVQPYQAREVVSGAADDFDGLVRDYLSGNLEDRPYYMLVRAAASASHNREEVGFFIQIHRAGDEERDDVKSFAILMPADYAHAVGKLLSQPG